MLSDLFRKLFDARRGKIHFLLQPCGRTCRAGRQFLDGNELHGISNNVLLGTLGGYRYKPGFPLFKSKTAQWLPEAIYRRTWLFINDELRPPLSVMNRYRHSG